MSKSKVRAARELGLNGNDLNNVVLAEMHARVETEVDAGVEIFVRAAENLRNMRRLGGGNVVNMGKKTMGTRSIWKRTIPVIGLRFQRERELNPKVLASVGG